VARIGDEDRSGRSSPSLRQQLQDEQWLLKNSGGY